MKESLEDRIGRKNEIERSAEADGQQERVGRRPVLGINIEREPWT